MYKSAGTGAFDQTVQQSMLREADEFLAVIKSVCTGDSQEMQDYIREQPGRLERLDGIIIVVEYLQSADRYFENAIKRDELVAEESRRAGHLSPRGAYGRSGSSSPKGSPKARGRSPNGSPNVKIERTISRAKIKDQTHSYKGASETELRRFDAMIIKQVLMGVDTVADIVDGPNMRNQEHAVRANILETVSRILQVVSMRRLPKKEDINEFVNGCVPYRPAVRATDTSMFCAPAAIFSGRWIVWLFSSDLCSMGHRQRWSKPGLITI